MTSESPSVLEIARKVERLRPDERNDIANLARLLSPSNEFHESNRLITQIVSIALDARHK